MMADMSPWKRRIGVVVGSLALAGVLSLGWVLRRPLRLLLFGHGRWPAAVSATFFVATAGVVLAVVYRRIVAAPTVSAADGNVELADLYTRFELPAKFIKSGLQMLVGLVAVLAIAAHVVYSMDKIADVGSMLLSDIGVALAAAAVIELAYTLFTPGPDEALNPLMLGVSSGMLLELNNSEGTSVSSALILLILGIILGGLFLVRLLLVESKDYEAPAIWWSRHLDRWLEKRTQLRASRDPGTQRRGTTSDVTRTPRTDACEEGQSVNTKAVNSALSLTD